MKTLYLARHAKSSWKYEELSDFERPLNSRGRRDAPLMGAVLNRMNIKPDLIISSPASRAITYARILAEHVGYPLKRLRTDERIYEATPDDLLEVIHSVSDRHAALMLFGHNPSLTWLSNSLSNYRIDNIPTSAIVAVEFDVEHWTDVVGHSGTVVFFEYPRKYTDLDDLSD